MPRVGSRGAGAMRRSLSTIREWLVIILIAQPTPFWESAARMVVESSVMSPLRS